MQKLILIPFLLCLFHFSSSAQRYADLAVMLHSPINGDTLYIGDTLVKRVYLKNNGADTLQLSDTIALELKIRSGAVVFPPSFTPYKLTDGNYLLPGDSVLFIQISTELYGNIGLGNMDICARIWSMNTVDTLLDTIAVNDTSCVTVIIAKKTVDVLKLDLDPVQVVAYPNPVYDIGYLDITSLEMGNIDICITDIAGRKIMERTEQVTSSRHIVRLDTRQMPAGMYIYRVKTANSTVTGKLKVQ